MHPDLSPHLHTEECNMLIDMLKQCHQDYKFLKYFGQCNDINRDMLKCLRNELEAKRTSNRMESEKRRQMNLQAQRAPEN